MHNEGKSPELIQYAVKQFNKKCKLDIHEVKFVEQSYLIVWKFQRSFQTETPAFFNPELPI
jgi:hypothetical protein